MDATLDPTRAAELKACCVAAYEGEWARLLGGVSWHPGGVELTLAMARQLGVTEQSTVLDVASGAGTSAIALAHTLGCRVIGVDLGARNVAAARAAAEAAGVAHLVRFEVGDAERLPVADGSADAVICECAFCTFPDKPTAARELARVVRPGGGVGLSDLTLEGAVPPALETVVGWVSCVAGALPLHDYSAHLERAGLTVEGAERHDQALRDLLARVRVALLGAEIGARLGRIAISVDQVDSAKRMLRAATDAVAAGALGYGVVIARRVA
ncbi:MAG: methyltransferase domain-containing protein [Dehalococcoidia bacterium]